MPLVPGQAIGTGIGATTPTPTVPLRSNKTPAALLARPLGGQATFATPGSVRAARSRALTGIGISTAQHSFIGAPPDVVWDIGDIALQFGQSGQPAGQFDVETTLPAGVVADGVFELDLASAPLPDGMTLSSVGVLDVGSASIGAQSGVVFAYSEPGALPTLTLYNNSVTGVLPYLATWFPTEGTVPFGMDAASPDDASLRGSVISRWPDSSARVIVLAGVINFAAQNTTRTVRLRAGPANGPPLSDARLEELVSSITVNFSGTPQTLTLAGATRDRIWWANERVICGRYRLSCGLGVMEAVIDIHAFAASGGDNYAWVEIVIENCKVNSTLSTVPVPQAQTYSGATVAINGTTVATLGMPLPLTWGGNPVWVSGTHEGLRAVYVGAWVKNGVATPIRGASDPFIEVVHDAASLHSLYVFPGKPARTKTYNAETSTSVVEFAYTKSGIANVTQPYRDDLYAPWDIGRNKGAGMGSAGGIRQLPRGDWQYIQGPDRWTRRGVIASTLALHSFPINYRDSTTGDVPTWAQIGSKQRSAVNTWPQNTAYPDWEGAHQPGYGLTAFLCQPSPCFIDLMQKICCWNGSWSTPVSAPNYAQTRQRAWLLRNCIHALYATPDGHPYKSSIEQSLAGYISYIDQFRTSGRFEAGVFMGVTLTSQEDARDEVAGFQAGHWQQTWLLLEAVRALRTKIHSNPTVRAQIQTVAEWQMDWAVRWVNEQPTGGWRYMCQYHTVGSVGAALGNQFFSEDPQCFANWDDAAQWAFLDYPPPGQSGPWMGNGGTGTSGGEDHPRYSNYAYLGQPNWFDYIAYVWPAFCVSVEYGMPGADTMWNTIHDNVTNLTQWLNPTATDPDHKCVWPRNKPVDK